MAEQGSELDAWVASLGLRVELAENLRASADTLDDLRLASREDLESCFGHWKPLPKARLLREVAALSPAEARDEALRVSLSPPPADARKRPGAGADAGEKPREDARKRPGAGADAGEKPREDARKRPGAAADAGEKRSKKAGGRWTPGEAQRRAARHREISRRVKGLKDAPETRLRFAQPNPKSKLTSAHGRNAAARYASYSAALTVGDFFALGGRQADLEYDAQIGHCELVDWDGAAAPPATAAAGWTARYDEVVWLHQGGYEPWPAIVLDPEEAAEPVRTRAMRAAGDEYLCLNFQSDDSDRYAFAAPEKLTPWAAGVESGFRERRWTGKYALFFAAAVREAAETHARANPGRVVVL